MLRPGFGVGRRGEIGDGRLLALTVDASLWAHFLRLFVAFDTFFIIDKMHFCDNCVAALTMAATSSPPTLQAASPASGLASASNNSFFSALFAANNPPEEGRPTSGHSSHGTNYSGDQGVQELKANIRTLWTRLR